MPAVNRKSGASSNGLQSLDERARVRAPDNFASIQTYYRSAALAKRQVGGGGEPAAVQAGRRLCSSHTQPLPRQPHTLGCYSIGRGY